MLKSGRLLFPPARWVGPYRTLLAGLAAQLSRENIFLGALGFCLGRAAVLGWPHPFALAYLAATRYLYREKSLLGGAFLLVGMAARGEGLPSLLGQAILYFAFLVGYGLLERKVGPARRGLDCSGGPPGAPLAVKGMEGEPSTGRMKTRAGAGMSLSFLRRSREGSPRRASAEGWWSPRCPESPPRDWVGFSLSMPSGSTAAVVALPQGPTVALVAAMAAIDFFVFQPGGFSFVTLLHLCLRVTLAATGYCLLGRGLTLILAGESDFPRPGEDWLPAMVVLGMALLGLVGLSFGPWNLVSAVVPFLVLGAARLGGTGAGTGMGLVTGLVDLLGGGAGTAYLTAQAVAGLLTGFFREFGRLASVGAYLAGNLLLVAAFPALGKTLPETVAVVLLATALPDAWWEKATLGLLSSSRDEETPGILPGRLRHLAGLFGGMARTIRSPETETKEAEVPWICSTVVEQVCRPCPSFHACWRLAFYRTYQRFLDLLVLGEGSSGGLALRQIPSDLRESCARYPELLAATNVLREAGKRYQGWEERVLGARRLVSEQLLGVAEIMGTLATEAVAVEEGQRPRALRFGYIYGASARPKGKNQVSGDSFLVRPVGHRLVLALSDGMGTGAVAAAESRAALSLLEGLFTAGFSPRLAAKSVNAALNLREVESFATLDLGVVDLETGEAEFGKVGAVHSYLIRGRRVITIAGPCPPAGILREVEPAWQRRELLAGDVLVLVSDGIVPYPGEEDRMPAYLERIGIREPRAMAERIVELAVAETGGEAEDDLTVLVVHLLPALRERG